MERNSTQPRLREYSHRRSVPLIPNLAQRARSAVANSPARSSWGSRNKPSKPGDRPGCHPVQPRFTLTPGGNRCWAFMRVLVIESTFVYTYLAYFDAAATCPPAKYTICPLYRLPRPCARNSTTPTTRRAMSAFILIGCVYITNFVKQIIHRRSRNVKASAIVC